jgi:ParB family chromosome partitioning protein
MSAQAVLRSIPLSAIRASPYQYRTRFDDARQRQLVESLRVSGLSTPILVRPLDGTFELVSGERRCRAAKELGWESIQALCEEMTDAEAAARVVTENEVRSDANILERAEGYKRLTEPPCRFSLEEIAHRYGLSSASSVKRIVDLLDEPVTIRDLLSRERIGEGHVRYLSRIKDKKARVRLAKRAADEGWTVKTTEARVAKKLGDAPKAARTSKGRRTKESASYENDYNQFHCALIGEQVELSGRRFKMNDEMMDQYLSDYRAALESFVRDIREGPTTERAPESSGELASSNSPKPEDSSTRPASLDEDVANFNAAGQSIKDILSEIGKQPGTPTTADLGGDGATSAKPPK